MLPNYQTHLGGSGARLRPLRITVAVNERGRRIGESHQNAVISDVLVDQMRDRHEDDGLGYRKIAREFGVALTTVRKICTYERRAQTADRWKTVLVRKPKAIYTIPLTWPTNLITEQDNYDQARNQGSEQACGQFCGSQ